ncbi:hypothetical protein P43SY_000466 [Pythium insidiosum]|uniref:Rab-GAP TBC domain-containing protein n=1 Tax=Pythium insidiosum TaxID=114742 RepID=A0AAD5LW31_PYTIN|nr:hypothetical protein P43SY_000466 [Pythium insidiosum]
MRSTDELQHEASAIPDEPAPPTSSNPFRNALHKFANKKKDKAPTSGSSAASGFFSRAAKGINKSQPLPGSVKQVCGGQLPPVWATPPPSAPRRGSSPTSSGTKSPSGEPSLTVNEQDEDTTSASLEQVHVSVKPNESTGSVPTPSASASTRPSSRNSTGNHRCEQFNQLLQGDVIDLDKLRQLSWGGVPYDHRPNVWRLLLGYMPSKHDRRESMLQRKRQEYRELLQQYYYIPDTDRGIKEQSTLRQILVDIPRTNAEVKLFQDERIHQGYMPSKHDRRESMLQRKRQEYRELLQQYYYIPDTDRGVKEQSTLRQILVDIPRTNAEVKLFQDERIHQCMERVLYTWAIRHPASGYVQGINDLLTPFLVVFLSVFMEDPQHGDLSLVSDERLDEVEADSYWCLTKLLDGIQDHYTFAQPGLQRMVHRMEELVHRCDAELFKHIVEHEGVQFVQFAFRWMNCLLMREVPLNAIIRLWDTYLCEDSGFEGFHVYVCAAILMTFGEKLKTLEFQDLVLFLQHLPTQDWNEDEIDPLLSRAFILQTYFADSPSHLS